MSQPAATRRGATPPRVLVASFEGRHETVTDDPLLLGLLQQRGVVAQAQAWTDDAVAWDDADLVWVRTVWDYTFRPQQWQAWLAARRTYVENPPGLVAWNSDKRYLADLAAAGLPTVPTAYVAPGEPLPVLRGEVVVKPTVSAGGRDTGRFGPAAHEAARGLVAHIGRSGRTAMVQPFLPSVDAHGETAVVLVDGEVSHTLHKRAVLAPDEVAPLRDDPLGAAEAMYDPQLVRAGRAAADELALAHAVLGHVREIVGTTPLQMRVDMVRAADGTPVVLELEAVEPHLYLDQVPGSADRLVDAVLRRLDRRPRRRAGDDGPARGD
jgi:hypothetical protein